MKKRIFWIILSSMMVLSLVLASCTTAVEEEEEEEEEEYVNWWDKFGEPEYGGTLTVRVEELAAADFDPANLMIHGPYGYWCEGLCHYDWTLSRDIFPFTVGYVPDECWTGLLAESWEWTDPQTVTFHLRQDVYWQDREPVNGRKYVADDVQYTFDRLLGTGSGFTEPNPIWTGMLAILDRVVATDDYTVDFKLKTPSVAGLSLVLQSNALATTVAREWVELAELSNYEYAVGTGPWMLTDYVSDVSLTCTGYSDYWGTDARHPGNQIPYLDKIKEVVIVDDSTAISAIRTGKVDLLPGGLSWQQSANLANTNPEIKQSALPGTGTDLELRCDTEPFTDINVRKALQMAIDCETIAKTYYGGYVDGIPCGIASPTAFKGWITPYEEWPEELKHEYGFYPDESMQLLAEAGYPDGFKTNITASTTNDLELLEIIQSYFLDIGVDMSIATMDIASFRSYGAALKHDQMLCSTNCGMFFIPSDIVRWRHSENTRDNWTLNNDPYYDSLVEQFNAATDIAEAKRIFNEADLYLLEQHWAIQMFPTAAFCAWQPYFKGYDGELTITGSERGYYGARWWIDQDLKESMGH